MRISTFKKYFIMLSSIFLLCMTFTVVILSIIINYYFAKQKFDTLNSTCSFVSDFAASDYRSSAYKRNIQNISRAINKTQGDLIFVADTNGVVFSCSCDKFTLTEKCEHSQIAVESKYLDEINSSDYKKTSRLGETFSEIHFICADAIKSFDGEIIGYVFAASPNSILKEFNLDLLRFYVFSAIVPIIIMFFAVYAMTYRWNKPLKLMSEAAKSMAKGDFSKRIPVTSNDEIGALSESFNQLTNSLERVENMRRGFIANVSHELKTPMTTISGFIDGMIDGTIDKAKHEYYLQIVSDEVKRLSRIVQGMLSLSKLEAGETKLNPTNFDFSQLILNVVLSQEQRIEEKNLSIVGLDKLKSSIIYADKDLIHQVVYNLCDNAIKFSNEGGVVTFDISLSGDLLCFKISNTGYGITEKDLPNVFERFYKGDKSRSENKDSTGLGLYLVKTIVNIHGGRVFVSSKPNEYTQFGVELPVFGIKRIDIK